VGYALLLAAALQVTAAARSQQPGELVVLTIRTTETVQSVHVRAFNRSVLPFRVDAGTWRALVGIDLDAVPGTYSVSIDANPGAHHASYDLVVAPRRFRTRTLTVDPAFVTPPAAERERIERESQLLAATWRHSAAERLWTGAFVRPVPQPANSAFGTRSIFNGEPRNAHSGADFMSPAGTPIRAPNAGRVVVARSLYFSGNTVIIDHGLGLFSLLAHLSAFDVHEGDRVTAGQIVGRVGATGRVTGPHLHWAVRAEGARVDPLSLLAVLGAARTGTRGLGD
jgi:murein DD-endopeptidase MepM/ murein hydrolase activator NlpD